jgi:hypothetical protein
MCASQIGAERQSGKKTGKNREKHRSCQNNASCAVHLDKPSKNNIIISIMRSVRPFSLAAGGVAQIARCNMIGGHTYEIQQKGSYL